MTQAAVGACTPTVSVIVPTFDRRPLLQQAVASVLGQSFGDLELVVVDEEGAPRPWPSGGSAAPSGWVALPLLTDALGVTICTVMVERALFREVGGFDERLRRRQDYALVVRLALCAPVHGVDESLVRVRHHAGRTTTLQPPERLHLGAAEAFGALMPHLPPALRRIARRRRALHLAEAGARLLKKGGLREAAGCFAQAAASGAGALRLATALARGVR